jgi:hypothetical protein
LELPPESPEQLAGLASVLLRCSSRLNTSDKIADERPTDVRTNVPPSFTTRAFAPLRKRLERRLRQFDFLSVTIGRDNGHGEFVAVPVVGGTLAVDAEE